MQESNKILVLNCGSSSVKYALFTKQEKEICRGIVEHIKETGKTHHQAIQQILHSLIKKKI